MGYNRPEAKWLARDSMRGAYPHPMLVSLVYILMTSVLSTVIMNYVADPFQSAYYYLTHTDYGVEEILSAFFTPSQIMIILVMELLINLYYWVVNYGYTSYCLRLARREGPGYRNLLDGFYNIGRALAVNFLVSLFTVLWSLIGIVVYVAAVFLAVISGLTVLIILGAIFMAAWTIAVSYRYRLSVYFLLDHPEMGALEAIGHSKAAMRGHIMDLFVQDLSFLGWALLSVFTFGILGLWLNPYMGAAEANFYHWVVYGTFPGAPTGGWKAPYGDL